MRFADGLERVYAGCVALTHLHDLIFMPVLSFCSFFNLKSSYLSKATLSNNFKKVKRVNGERVVLSFAIH